MPKPNPIATASPKFRSYNDLIRHFEASGKVRTQAYLDSEGIPTIGWGATTYKDGTPVKMGQSITPKQAEDLLRHHSEVSVSNLTKLPNWNNYSKHQQDALKSFAYNAGPNFMDSPNFKTMADAIRNGDNAAIGKAFGLYTNGGNAGLVKRRQAEAALFNTPVNTPNQQGQYNPNSVGKQGPTFTPGKLGSKKGKQSFNTDKMTQTYQAVASNGQHVTVEPLKIKQKKGKGNKSLSIKGNNFTPSKSPVHSRVASNLHGQGGMHNPQNIPGLAVGGSRGRDASYANYSGPSNSSGYFNNYHNQSIKGNYF